VGAARRADTKEAAADGARHVYQLEQVVAKEVAAVRPREARARLSDEDLARANAHTD